MSQSRFNSGVLAALGAALLFGAGTPLAKMLLKDIGPWMLAGLFYLGSGLGLALFRLITRAEAVSPQRMEITYLVGATFSGGVIGPLLLMLGLTGMPASGASLLLNAEGVFTALLAWFVFKENFDYRIALGMVAIAAGAILLSWPEQANFASIWPALAILGACLAWGIDNNLTRKVSLSDATWIASFKGLVAGSVNLMLANAIEPHLPSLAVTGMAMVVGFLCYGVSHALFVLGLRHLGTARTGAYFSVAPFFGAILALIGGEPLTARLIISGLLMGLGVWLHLTEHHDHQHIHEVMEHTHEHTHDEHHQHTHDQSIPPGTKHTHPHRHEPLVHSHEHFPDMHHQEHQH